MVYRAEPTAATSLPVQASTTTLDTVLPQVLAETPSFGAPPASAERHGFATMGLER